ncbi:MAG: RusA family crossover junction endodeoxyribonuclease [Alphaproteobacteria bacterium]|nr:RusA family crossover junction endodeoxyribonuclease [Alphaproteobacteria bacterium]
MQHFFLKISGVPYGKAKTRGNIKAPKEWTEAIKKQTKSSPKVKEACMLKVTFLLPPDKFPSDFPYGSDLDNLLKRFLDALNDTIFSEALGKDSCIISLIAQKTKVKSNSEAGVLLEITPVSV